MPDSDDQSATPAGQEHCTEFISGLRGGWSGRGIAGYTRHSESIMCSVVQHKADAHYILLARPVQIYTHSYLQL